MQTLSIVLPTYNSAEWLGDTLGELRRAIELADWGGAEIIIVDDGSTDGTADLLAADVGTPPLTIVRQANGGRFRAREAGVRRAAGELVLFIDARVHAHPDSLRFARQQLADHPDRTIWNGHVHTAAGSSVFSGFWDAITHIAWRRYLRDPRLTSYGIDEYDFFPKGTTFFLAPRASLLEVFESFESSFGDLHHANDDTLLIRPLAESGRINLSPEFACTYFPRDNAKKFLAHSYHRGTVFVDGYYRPGTRFYRPLQVLLLLAPAGVVAAVKWPRQVFATVIGGSAALGAAARILGVPGRNARSLGVLAPLFALSYGSGILRGMALRIRRGGNP